MDLFTYRINLKELELCTKVKDLELLVRKYTLLCSRSTLLEPWSTKETNTSEPIVLLYKLLVFSLKCYSERSKNTLPDFIYNTQKKAHKVLLNTILGFNINSNREKCFPLGRLISYEEFMDWFEFDTVLTLPNIQPYAENLNAIIGSNPIHFRIVFNKLLTSFDHYSIDLPDTTKVLVYTIRYKQINFPDTPQTVWDLFIKESLIEAMQVPKKDIDASILKLEQQITALKHIKEIL